MQHCEDAAPVQPASSLFDHRKTLDNYVNECYNNDANQVF